MIDRPNAAAPHVSPVADEAARPRWSVMIPTYDSGDHLRQRSRASSSRRRAPR